MTHLKTIGLAVWLVLAVTGIARAGDCYNDDGAAVDDLEPAVLKVTDADMDALRAAIRAHEQRTLAAGEAKPVAAARIRDGADSPS